MIEVMRGEMRRGKEDREVIGGGGGLIEGVRSDGRIEVM